MNTTLKSTQSVQTVLAAHCQQSGHYTFRLIAVISLLTMLLLTTTTHAKEAWKWIYQDDTCSAYADFNTMHIWKDKPEGTCVDIYTMANLTAIGREELLTGREINNMPTKGWETISTIVTRQLFMFDSRKVQTLETIYYDQNGTELAHDNYSYSPARWTPLRTVERSQKVYDVIVNIANNFR